MAEEPVFFMSGPLQIQGLLQTKPGNKGVVITHPTLFTVAACTIM